MVWEWGMFSFGVRVAMVEDFLPDTTIFTGGIEFNFDYLTSRLRELAFLNPGITIELVDERGDEDRKAAIHGVEKDVDPPDPGRRTGRWSRRSAELIYL